MMLIASYIAGGDRRPAVAEMSARLGCDWKQFDRLLRSLTKRGLIYVLWRPRDTRWHHTYYVPAVGDVRTGKHLRYARQRQRRDRKRRETMKT